jgi:tetratricopeptide (TPR) repeat protein/DNA-binding XRE family transcriptional regulator
MERPAARLPRPRRKGVEIRPGSVREARIEAGLSLAQVAGSDVTRAAIHLIESGRAKPSLPTLELIARRTGKPLSFFMPDGVVVDGPKTPPELQSRVSELERLSLSRDDESVLKLSEWLIERGLSRADEAQVRLLAGQARVQTKRPQGALVHLRRARALFEDLGDEWMVVECLDWESAALGEDPASLDLAREALERCRSLDPIPVDLEARILSRIAAKHLQRHEWEEAIESYDAALEVSKSLRDLDRMARLHDGLSDAYRQLGNLDQANRHAQRAIALHSVARDRTMLARSENNLGVLLIEQRRFGEAGEHLRRALELCADLGIEGGRAHVVLSLAELEIARGNGEDARSFLAEARALARRQKESMTLAFAHQLAGRLAAAEGDEQATDREYRQALKLMAETRAGERLVRCHSEFAAALEKRGDTAGAAEQYRLAVEAGRARHSLAETADLTGGWRPALAN